METWSTLLANIRDELQDTGTTQRWSDKVLFLYTKDAIRDYSTFFPKRIDRCQLSLTVDHYVLPSDYIQDIQVEAPLETMLERRRDRPGTRYVKGALQAKKSYYYFVSGGNLYAGETPASVWLTYFATHAVPASEQDSTFAMTIPDADMELIRTYVRAKVYGHMRSRQAALDRFKTVGKRDDNPLMPESDNLFDEYLRMVAQRMTGGVVMLYKMGRP
jgi:hypothetical protein